MCKRRAPTSRPGRPRDSPHLGYPPLSFLAILPAAAAGFTAVTIWVVALVLLTLYLLARRDWKAAPWSLATTGLAFAWFILTSEGNPEILTFCALIIAVAYMDRPILSAALLGAAMCANELAWLVAPIYLIIGLRLPTTRTRMLTLLITVVAVIGGWMLWDHHFLSEEWAFIVQPLYPLGTGLVTLLPASRVGSALFDVTFVLGLSAAYVLAWRRPDLAWAMLGVCWVCFWLSWRSMTPYYLPMLWLTPAVLVARDRALGRGSPTVGTEILGVARARQPQRQNHSASTP